MAGQSWLVAGAGDAAKSQTEAEMGSVGLAAGSDTPIRQTAGDGKNGLVSKGGEGRQPVEGVGGDHS